MRSLVESSKAPNRISLESNSLRAAPPLPLNFYVRPAKEVARDLLGKGLVVVHRGTPIAVKLVEVEAYFEEDPASHSFSGPSRRNAIMFEKGGVCYVYLSYGVHYCMNVVTGSKHHGDAVLIRAVEPIHGLEILFKNRGLPPSEPPPFTLLNGPGKLTQALGINAAYNGRSFRDKDFKLIDLGVSFEEEEIGESPRIGISKAKDELLRYFIRSSPWVSKAR